MALTPKKLESGDTIGIITPGSPLDANTINTRVQYLRNLGFNIVLGNYVYSAEGITATSPEKRAEDVMNMFTNQEVKMILPTRGGTGVQSILPHLDFEVIKKNPKIITGYSDITVLLNSLFQQSDLITFHSLMLINFRPETDVYNFNQFYEATTTVRASRIIQNPPNLPLRSLVPGNVTAPIIGGNLTSLVNTFGTPYEMNTKGKILFLEETHTPATFIYRYFSQLILSGKLNDCVGIIMGQCSNCPASYRTTYEVLIQYMLAPLGKPLMINLATGHGTYKAAIPIGATVNLNTTNNTLTVVEPTVSSSS